MSAVAAHAADTGVPSVLILHSNQRATPAAVVIENVLVKQVPEGFQRPVQVFSEYLDIEWASTEAYSGAQVEFLRQKYSTRNIKVIVASASAAIPFAIKLRDLTLPGVPIVHIAMPKDQLESASLPADVVGSTVDLDPTPTLKLAQRLQPNAKRLVVIVGASERDRAWEQRVRKAVAGLETPIEAEYLSGLPNEEVVRRLRVLERDTIVYTPGYFVDGTGKVQTPRQSLELIAPASNAPVYGPLDTFLGTGMVGGYMAPYEEQARQAAAIVVRLLNGAAASEIPMPVVASVPMIDSRAARRFGIDESLLPGDAIVRFREPTPWDKYRHEISIGFAILLIQAGLIAALLIERRTRLRTATALEESQKQITLAARAAKLSMWVWGSTRDKSLPAARSQPAYERPLQFDDILEHAHPADREDVEHAVRKALKTGREIDVEYRVVTADGDVRWIAARGRAEKGDGHHVLGVAIDITERKRAELRAVEDRNALRHMTRVSMLGQLSASIAHQLNQPLAAILGNAEAARTMLGRPNVDLDELREICNDIVTEDNRAAEVIRRLGALYKRGDMKTEVIDLNTLIRDTLELLRAELLIRHVTPVTEFAESLPEIDGGSVQMQQVLLNLVLNAADAMGATPIEQRRLIVRTEAAGSQVRFCVMDNGSGIAPKDLPHVFDAFWSTKADGMGIGLAICQSIVAAHHGSISVSNNAGGGATFCVTVPVRHRA